MMQRCSECGWYNYPPNVICTSCLADPPKFEWAAVSGTGRVKTWTVMRDSFLPGFDDDVPYVVADVELAKQAVLRMVARLVGIDEHQVRLGLPVEVVFDDVADGLAVPQFKRVTS